MKALIQHYLRSNFKEILNKSLMNCHCIGLHSIMLSECPGKTIRLFITDPSHELWKNANGEEQSIAYHPHHCDITLHVVKGAIGNFTVFEVPELRGITVNKYLYKSHISEGEMKFAFIRRCSISDPKLRLITQGDHLYMDAAEIHTVFCTQGTINAWLVYEGYEDENYIPYCWTNKELDGVTGDNLYQKFTQEKLLTLMDSIGITINF